MSIARHRGYKDKIGEQLTAKEDLFIEAFIGPAQGNAYKATQLAGYADSTSGYKVLQRPEIRRAIDLRIELIAKSGAALSPLEIHACWRRLSKHPDPVIKLRATENAAKAQGMFIARTESVVTTVIAGDEAGISGADSFLKGLDDDELDAFIEFVRIQREKKVIDVTPEP